MVHNSANHTQHWGQVPQKNPRPSHHRALPRSTSEGGDEQSARPQARGAQPPQRELSLDRPGVPAATRENRQARSRHLCRRRTDHERSRTTWTEKAAGHSAATGKSRQEAKGAEWRLRHTQAHSCTHARTHVLLLALTLVLTSTLLHMLTGMLTFTPSCTHTHVPTCTLIHACTHTLTHPHVHSHSVMHAHLCTYTCTDTRAHKLTFMHSYAHLYTCPLQTQAHMLTFMHAHSH